MPSLEHEYVLHLCRNRPEMVVELLRDCFGAPIPDGAKVALDCGDFGEPEVHERRGDTALLVHIRGRPDPIGLVVESQRKYVKSKFRRWGVYSTTLGDRNDCLVDVVVFCPDQKEADKYDVPYHLGTRHVLHPYVVGPNRVPVVNTPPASPTPPSWACSPPWRTDAATAWWMPCSPGLPTSTPTERKATLSCCWRC
jgi:hypothetical protein